MGGKKAEKQLLMNGMVTWPKVGPRTTGNIYRFFFSKMYIEDQIGFQLCAGISKSLRLI